MTEVPEDQVRDLERGAEEMEEGLGRLEGHIETAQERAAEQRERADPEAVAGDWEDESAGAQQGDDARDAEDREGPSGSTADAPVHEATEVTPGEEGGSEEESEDDSADPPVHEAERVEAEGSGAEESGEGESGDDAPADDDFVA